MTKRWLAATLTAAWMLTAAIGPAFAIDGRIAALAAPNTPWDDSWTEFKTYLRDNPSTVNFRYYIRGEIGNEDEMLAALRRNRVQIMGSSLQGLATLVPELTVAMSPYLFDSAEEVDFVYDNYLLEPAAELMAAKGLTLLRWNEVGWTDFYSNVPVRVPADARELKIRGAPNVSAQVFLRGIGANSVPIGSVDLVPALQRGLVEGGTSNLIFHYFSTRQYAKYVTLTHHSYDTGGSVAHKGWWDSATPEEQETIMNAFGSPDKDRRAVRNLVAEIKQRLRDEGVVIIELTAEERAKWVEKTRPLVQEIIDEVGGQSELIYEAIVEGKQAFAAFKADQQARGRIAPSVPGRAARARAAARGG